jgi:multiple sugar transport system ATP-binding protein
MAMMFQNYVLFPHMTVFDNIAFGLKIRKVDSNEIRKKVREVAEMLGIAEFLKRYPHELSGGQRQRAALGRAILRNPRVFLLDEPLSNLDAKMRSQMRLQISNLQKKLQTTMIFVTHDQAEAMTMGDRIVVLKNGRIQQVSDPVTIYNKPVNQFVAGFIGTPSMNFFKGLVVEKKDQWLFQHKEFSLPIPHNRIESLRPFAEQKVWLGIRSEDMHPALEGPESGNSNHGTFSSKVKGVEHMGSHSFIIMETRGYNFAAMAEPDCNIAVGRQVILNVDMSKAHFFDRATEKVI